MDDEHDRYDQAVREALEAAAALIQATAAEAESLRRGSSSGSVPPPSHRPPPRLHNHKRLHVNQYQFPRDTGGSRYLPKTIQDKVRDRFISILTDRILHDRRFPYKVDAQRTLDCVL